MRPRRSSSSAAAADLAHEIRSEREACQIANEAHRLRLIGLEAQLAALDASAEAPPADETAEAPRRLAELGGA